MNFPLSRCPLLDRFSILFCLFVWLVFVVVVVIAAVAAVVVVLNECTKTKQYKS